MQNRFHQRAILCVLFGLLLSGRAFGVSDNFSSNPLLGGSPWSFGVGDNSHSQFAWSSGALTVHVNSSLPTVRLDRPLGVTLDDTSSFVLSARFSFSIPTGGAPGDQASQIAFALTKHLVTGGDRTGSNANFSSDNTFDTVEFNYFPNVSTSFGGPSLSPAVFGGSVAPDAFSNFSSIFGSASNLGDNISPAITALPQNTTLEAHLAYNGTTKLVTLAMYQVAGDNSLTLLSTGLTPLDLAANGTGYDASNPFQVDTLSILTYNDGFTTSQTPSLKADITYQSISLTVPEPSALVLAFAGGLCAIGLVVRRRKIRCSLAGGIV